MARDRLLKALLRERFLVTLTTGETFDGLLDRHDESTIELLNVHAVTAERRVPVDGRIYFPRGQVAYMQRPEAQ